METKIPKIIHQIWIGPKKEPTIWTNTWKIDYIAKYPEYQYILWNDLNIVSVLNKHPNIKIMYELEELWSGKSDFLRYIILYEYGGIYIDADSVWINEKNLDELIDNTKENGIFVAYEPDVNKITTGVMGSTKNNKILLNVITELNYLIMYNDKISKRRFIRARKITGVPALFGPYFFSNMCIDKVTIFPSHYFYPITWHGVSSIDQHKNMNLPKDSFMFQYGYTTNNLENFIQ
jgi:mannosyltransferase OCH1-like enzyme